MPREFRLQDGSSDKFWIIEREGDRFTVRFGRTGTVGQTQTKEFGSEEEAQKACARLIAEKLHKGYQEVNPNTPLSAAAPQTTLKPALDLGAVTVVGGPLVLATEAEVDALEASLGFPFPAGYREYVTTLGEGVLGGTFVRVYAPWTVEKRLAPWRERIDAYWFWDDGAKLLTKERALESIVLADTLNGDELLFHPDEPGRLLVLPIESEKIFVAGSTLLEAVEWMCSSGKLTRRFAERRFEPFDARLA